jgi:hypothetical protein
MPMTEAMTEATVIDAGASIADRDEMNDLCNRMWGGRPCDLFFRRGNVAEIARFLRLCVDVLSDEELRDLIVMHDDECALWGLTSYDDDGYWLDDERLARLIAAAREAFGPSHRAYYYVDGGQSVNVDFDNLTWKSEVTGEEGNLDDLRRRAAAPFAAIIKELERIITEDEDCDPPPQVVAKMIRYLVDVGPELADAAAAA